MIETDERRFKATIKGREIKALTEIEFKILNLLNSEPGCVFSRDEMLRKVWGYDSEQIDILDNRTVDVHVYRLRQKIRRANNNRKTPEVISNVRQRGYKINA